MDPVNPESILQEVANELGSTAAIYKVNVDENTDLAQEHGVNSFNNVGL